MENHLEIVKQLLLSKADMKIKNNVSTVISYYTVFDVDVGVGMHPDRLLPGWSVVVANGCDW